MVIVQQAIGQVKRKAERMQKKDDSYPQQHHISGGENEEVREISRRADDEAKRSTGHLSPS